MRASQKAYGSNSLFQSDIKTNNTKDNNLVIVQHPGFLQFRDLRRSYVWQSVIQQSQLFLFAGIQDTTCNVVVNDVGCPYKFLTFFHGQPLELFGNGN